MSNAESTDKTAKKKFKMPSSLTIIIGVMFFFIVFTWILVLAGASYEDTDGNTTDVIAVGLLGFGNAIAEGFGNAYSLIFYLFVLGALIEILLCTGTLEAGIASLVKGLGGKELLLIPILFVLFSAGGTVYGMQEETIGLFVIIVPALVLAGFDTMTGLLVILLGTTTGFAMSTVNPFAVGAAEGVIDDTINNYFLNADVSIVGVGLIFRLVWWFVLTGIGASFVTGYAYRVQKDPNKSVIKSKKQEEDKEWVNSNFKPIEEIDSMTGRQKIAISLFMMAFVVMIFMMIPWADLTNWDPSEWIIYPDGAGWLFNGMAYPGSWYFGELIMLFIIVTVIIVLVLKMKAKDASEAAWRGAKDMFSVAILIGVARSIPQILEYSGTQTWMVQSMTSGLEGMSGIGFVYIMFFIFIILALIIPSTSGLAGAAFPIITGAAIATVGGVGNEAAQSTVELMSATMVVFLMAAGMANMFVPTQSVVMAQMDASHVNYVTALKPIFAYIGILFVITIAAIIPSTLLLM